MIRHLTWALTLAATLAGGAAAAKDTLPQRELNYGYASLYSAAKGLRHSDKIFLIKYETEAVQAVITDMSRTMDRITERLDALAKADPRLRLDDDGLPAIETRKREAVTRARLLSFKPISGRTGADFERTLLLSESGALNQLQHLVAELDQADPDPQRRAVLQEIHTELVRLYGKVVALLNRQYFR